MNHHEDQDQCSEVSGIELLAWLAVSIVLTGLAFGVAFAARYFTGQ